MLLLFARASAEVKTLQTPQQTLFLRSSLHLAAEIATSRRAQQALLTARRSKKSHWRKLRLLVRMGMLSKAAAMERKRSSLSSAGASSGRWTALRTRGRALQVWAGVIPYTTYVCLLGGPTWWLHSTLT